MHHEWLTKHFTTCASFEVIRGCWGILGGRRNEIDLQLLGGSLCRGRDIYICTWRINQILKFRESRKEKVKKKKKKKDSPAKCTAGMKGERGRSGISEQGTSGSEQLHGGPGEDSGGDMVCEQ